MGNEAWERQAGESDKAFEAFVVFRDLGPTRSLADVCRNRTGRVPKGYQKGTGNRAKGLSAIKRWSTKYQWVARATAYDANQDAIRQAARDKVLAKTTESDFQKWSARQQKDLDDDYLKATATVDIAAILASWTPYERTVTQRDAAGNEVAATYAPADTLHFWRAGALLFAAQRRRQEIIATALGIARGIEDDPTAVLPPPSLSMPDGPPVGERAMTKYDEWFAEKRRQVAEWNGGKNGPPKPPET